MVVSGYSKNFGKTRPGFEMDEFSQAYLIFKANGLEVQVASPKGGSVEADKYDLEKPYNKAFGALPEAQGLLENTLSTAQANAADYQAIYIVGGKGAAFDLPFDPALQDLVANLHAKGGWVSAVCHGPAAFAHIKKEDGKYWAEGKKMTGFTNAEEVQFGKRWKDEYPFLLEDKLKARGAQFEQVDVMLPHVCTDQNVITGQNPYSTTLLAEALVQALGKTPAARALYADEKTLLLVQKAQKGTWEEAREALKQQPKQYDMPLLAIYGFLRYKAAGDNIGAAQTALHIMNLADAHYPEPELDVARAGCYHLLGDKAMAKGILEAVLAEKPDHAEAKKALEGLK